MDKNFTISEGIKESLISLVPGYGTYNKYKKRKVLELANRYKDDGGTKQRLKKDAFKVGDDYGDYKLMISKKLEKQLKELPDDERKKVIKQKLKELYKNGTLLTDKDGNIVIDSD